MIQRFLTSSLLTVIVVCASLITRASATSMTPPPARVVVFVVDASGSMMPVFPAAIMEVKRAIHSLGANRPDRFNVIITSHDCVVPMWPEPRAVRQENKAKAWRWVARKDRPWPFVEGGQADLPLALAEALKMDSDLVYLLTDGQDVLTDELPTLTMLWQMAREPRVHVVEFDESRDESGKKLAMNTGGIWNRVDFVGGSYVRAESESPPKKDSK